MKKTPKKMNGGANGAAGSQRRLISANRAKRTAIEYCLFHYPTMYTAGIPGISQPGQWIIPVMLEDPDAAISSQVGEIRVDRHSGDVVSATVRAEVVAKGQKLYKGTRHARPAAVSAKEK